jgi:hypothetical protein
MDSEIKAAWIAALRSGLYKQGIGALKQVNNETLEDEYCCLGVLQEINGRMLPAPRDLSPSDASPPMYWSIADSSAGLVFEDHCYYDINDKHPHITMLVNMNDGDGIMVQQQNFNEIADYIEANF